MTNKRDIAGGREWLTFLGLVIAAAALCGAIYLAPAQTLQSTTVLVDHDGSTSLVRLPVIHLLQRMALAAGLILLVLAGVAWWRKAFFAALVARFVRDTREFISEVAGEMRTLASPENRWTLITLGLVTVAAVVLRILRLDDPIRFDEAYTFNVHASTPFFNLISDYTTPNNHVFHSVMVRCSHLLFGDSPLALRLPALVAGILVIPATFWWARRLFGDVPAVLASALAAGASSLIGYSANARGYTMVTLALLVVFSLAIGLRDKRNLFAWMLFVIVLTLGFFTVPVMLYGACVVGVWLLLSADGPRRWRMVLELSVAAASVAVLTCVLYTPIAVRVGVGAIVANPFVRTLPIDVFLNGLPGLVTGVMQSWAYPVAFLLALLAAVAASGAAGGHVGQQSRRLHVALWVTVAAIIAAQRVLPYTRVLVPLFPLAYGLAAVGLTMLVGRLSHVERRVPWRAVVVGVLALVLACGPALTRTVEAKLFKDLRMIIAELKPMLGENDVIAVVIPLNEPLRYHARRAQLREGAVEELRMRRTLLDRGEEVLFYMIEEKNPPSRVFVTFSLLRFKIDHPFLQEHFQQPEQVLETPTTRVFRMRVKPESRL